MPKFSVDVTVTLDVTRDIEADHIEEALDIAEANFKLGDITGLHYNYHAHQASRICERCDDSGLIDYDIVGESVDLNPCPVCT